MRARRRGAAAARAAIALVFSAFAVHAGVLPEDRADVLYHFYDGGGVQIDGPSILVQKKINQSFSVSGNYYVDSVSSASIDVVTQASKYSDERKEYSLGVNYLHNDTSMTLGATKSDESDYDAKTLNFNITQEVFGGMTTVSMGYGRGSDDVGERGTTLDANADHWRYRLGVSQIITRDLLLSLDYEALADEGYLHNPYRSVRYVDDTSPNGYSYQDEVYPQTRDSNAIALSARYYLPYRAAIAGSYRYFNDSWGVTASTFELGYTQPLNRWTYDIAYRFYTQTAADFYSDLFPYVNAQNFLGRDKELCSFTSHGIRLGVGYEMPLNFGEIVDRGSVNLIWDHIYFNYDDFRDLRVTGVTPGTEPLYDMDADVLQLFFSVWF